MFYTLCLILMVPFLLGVGGVPDTKKLESEQQPVLIEDIKGMPDTEKLESKQQPILPEDIKIEKIVRCMELIGGHNRPAADRINFIFVGSLLNQSVRDTALSVLGSDSTSVQSIFLNIDPFRSRGIQKIERSQDPASIRESKFPDGKITNAERTECETDATRCAEYDRSESGQGVIDTAPTILDSNSNPEPSTFFNTEPFRSNLNKFNFWYIEKDYGIELSYADERTKDIAEDANRRCNFANPQVFILKGNPQTWAWGGQLRGMAIYPFTTHTTQSFVHELGHSIGSLSDEYVTAYGGGTGIPTVVCNQNSCTAQYPNSYEVSFLKPSNIYYGPSRQACLQNAPWKHMIGMGCGDPNVVDCVTAEYYLPPVPPSSNSYLRNDDPNIALYSSTAANEVDCFEGAGLLDEGAFRSTFQSIMRFSHITGSRFGPYNEYLIEQELNQYSGQ